jgi:hypothetical protein
LHAWNPGVSFHKLLLSLEILSIYLSESQDLAISNV